MFCGKLKIFILLILLQSIISITDGAPKNKKPNKGKAVQSKSSSDQSHASNTSARTVNTLSIDDIAFLSKSKNTIRELFEFYSSERKKENKFYLDELRNMEKEIDNIQKNIHQVSVDPRPILDYIQSVLEEFQMNKELREEVKNSQSSSNSHQMESHSHYKQPDIDSLRDQRQTALDKFDKLYKQFDQAASKKRMYQVSQRSEELAEAIDEKRSNEAAATEALSKIFELQSIYDYIGDKVRKAMLVSMPIEKNLELLNITESNEINDLIELVDIYETLTDEMTEYFQKFHICNKEVDNLWNKFDQTNQKLKKSATDEKHKKIWQDLQRSVDDGQGGQKEIVHLSTIASDGLEELIQLAQHSCISQPSKPIHKMPIKYEFLNNESNQMANAALDGLKNLLKRTQSFNEYLKTIDELCARHKEIHSHVESLIHSTDKVSSSSPPQIANKGKK